MQESRSVSTVERVLAVIFSGNTFLGLCLPVALVYFKGCKGGPARAPETFTGWQLMPHDWPLYAVPLAAAIALLCAIFYRRQANVLFALFWSAVKAVLATFALSALGNGMLAGYHGDAADPRIGFWFAFPAMSAIFVLWRFNLLANIGPFRTFWKERAAGKVRGKLLTSVIVGDWFWGLVLPACAVALIICSLADKSHKSMSDVAVYASWIFQGAGFFTLFFALKFGLRRGQAWAALCHIPVFAVFAGLSVLILIDIGNPAKDNMPHFIIFSATAAWFAYTILAIILTRKTFKRAPKPPAPNSAAALRASVGL